MATIRVPQDFTTIAAAVASATAGDTIEVDASYAGGETFVSVTVNNLTFNGPAGLEVVLDAANGSITQITLTGAADFDIRGRSGNDTLTGNDGDNVIRGRSGDDTINGGGNTSTSGDWADYFGTTGDVQVTLTDAASPGGPTGGSSTGAAGNDTLIDIESIRGGDGNDTLTGNSNDGFLRGGLGDDTLDGKGGFDWADYIGASNSVSVTLTDATSPGGPTGGSSSGADGNDTLIDIEAIRGSTFGDMLTGNSGNNFLRGYQGDDTIDGGTGIDTADYRNPSGAVTVSLTDDPGTGHTGGSSSGADGNDTLTDIENIRGGVFGDTLTGNSNVNALIGLDGDDVLNGLGGNDFLNGGRGNDTLNGGLQVDTAVFSGNRADSAITRNSDNSFTIVGPDGTDQLNSIERVSFDDGTFKLPFGPGQNIDPATAAPATFMPQIRDFDGNDLGAGNDWQRVGSADVEGDGDEEVLFVNPTLGRWATVGVADDGMIYMENHNWGGDTRVVGTYEDPLIALGIVEAGSDFDSQVRFARDLTLDNIGDILGTGDYNNDGLQEIYFKIADGTAYLHAYMHADGNIQYANYQVQSQVEQFMMDNGVDPSVYSGWFA